MARRAAFTAAVVLFCAGLQFTLVNWARIAGVEPDLLLVVTVVIALLSGPRAGMTTGFSAGLVEGALLGRGSIAVYAGAKTLVGYLAGEAGGRLFVENLLVIMGASAVMTLVHEGIVGVFVPAAGVGVWKTVTAGLGQSAYNAGVALIVGAALRRMRRLLPPEEPRS